MQLIRIILPIPGYIGESVPPETQLSKEYLDLLTDAVIAVNGQTGAIGRARTSAGRPRRAALAGRGGAG